MNRSKKPVFASPFTFFSVCFLAFSFNACSGYCSDSNPQRIDQVDNSRSQLKREWTSANGKFRRAGTLKNISESQCCISFNGNVRVVRRDLLSELDQLFVAALEHADLDDSFQIAEAVYRISDKFDYATAAQRLIGKPIKVTTLTGETYSCSKLLELDPRRAKFLVGKTRTRFVSVCDFDSPSKFHLLYNRVWEVAYICDLKELAKIQKRARGNFRFAQKNGLLDSDFVFPIGDSPTSQSSSGLEWSAPCLVGGSVVATAFKSEWRDDYFGHWEKFDCQPHKRRIAESKKRARQAIAKSFKAKRRSYLACRSSYRTMAQLSYNGPVYVRGYYRKSGTYVRPHTRSFPRR